MHRELLGELAPGFAWSIETDLRWGDMDAYGHLNNTIYFRYFEDARMACFETLGITELMAEQQKGPILKSTSCRFRIPLVYPDRLLVATRIVDLRSDRFTMDYRVISTASKALAAEGAGEVVFFDYVARTKTDLPEALRARIAERQEATAGD